MLCFFLHCHVMPLNGKECQRNRGIPAIEIIAKSELEEENVKVSNRFTWTHLYSL